MNLSHWYSTMSGFKFPPDPGTSGLSSLRSVALILVLVCVLLFPPSAFADTEAVARRTVNGEVLYYPTLHEAFTAAGGTSLDNPDEITLLADIVLNEPISIESEKHIRLIAENGGRTITRGAVIDYPLFWIRADNASLTLGAPAAEGETPENSLAIDGGYLNEPSIEAHAPLIVVNGEGARLVMYDGVTLQNNYNRGAGAGTSLYENGGCVFIRTRNELPNLAAFIMKGGVIQGNINDTQNPFAMGGGVTAMGLGLFVMEGGEIRGNTTFIAGGGFAAGSRASFKKTGGVIYGKDAPKGLRNTALNGIDDTLTRVRVYAHAITINLPEEPFFHFRDDTVGEDEALSYEGVPTSRNGVFGEGETWQRPGSAVPLYILIGAFTLAGLALTGVLIFFIARTRRKKLAAISRGGGTPDPALLKIIENLTPSEKEVFDLLLTDCSLKEVASSLDIGYSGAHFHAQNIYRKLGVKSRTEFLIKFR